MATTRFPNGITTTTKTTTLGEFILPDPTQSHVFFDDFNFFVTANWTTTLVATGAGVGSVALDDADGGVLLLTNKDDLADSTALQNTNESFLFEVGKQLWFKSQIKLSTNETLWIMGLQITDITPKDVLDGVYISSPKSSTDISLTSEKDNVSSTTVLTSEDFSGTFFTVGFYYNGKDVIEGYVNDVLLGTLNIDNLPNDEVLTISFFVENATATQDTMSVDYILAAKER